MDLFKESQQFRQATVWVPLVLLVIALSGLLARKALAAFTGPDPNIGLGVAAIIGIVVPILTGVLLFIARLSIEVTATGLSFQFFPFHLQARSISWAEISSAQSVSFRPLADFGGYGIRYGKLGQAYIVKGTEGVQVILKDGSKIVFGSAKAGELLAAISKARSAR